MGRRRISGRPAQAAGGVGVDETSLEHSIAETALPVTIYWGVISEGCISAIFPKARKSEAERHAFDHGGLVEPVAIQGWLHSPGYLPMP
jgi:hypothetical protein